MSPLTSLPASGDCLLVSETFVSLQGEGLSTGAPAAFLRLGNCNLACRYCDTPYSWDESRFDLQDELSVREVADVAKWVADNAPGRLIITGGEPLLQQKLVARLLSEADALVTAPLVVEVETNGTVAPSEELLLRVDQWNVSPKLENSGEPLERRIRDKAFAAFVSAERANFKFVVRNEQDAREVELLCETWGIAAARVLLMPEARTVDELRARAPTVADCAARRQYRYSGRLHLELYGGKRGT